MFSPVGTSSPVRLAKRGLSLYALVLCMHTIRAEGLRHHFNLTEIYPHWVDRIRSVSASSPILPALRSDRDSKLALENAFQIFDVLYRAVRTRVRGEHALACNRRQESKWVKSSRRRELAFQIGEVSNDGHSSTDMRDAISNGEFPSSAPLQIMHARQTNHNAIVALRRVGRKIPLPTYNEHWNFKHGH